MAVSNIKHNRIGWLIALLPFGLLVYFLSFTERVAEGETLGAVYPWIPSLGIHLSFYLDGLSLMFALLISGVGTLVMIYAGSYLAGHHHLSRLYLYLLLFMTAMLGLVLSDNLLTMFVFWELTSISSYLLIGFNHHREEARAAALQALLITGAGGLALLVGFVLLGQVGGTMQISALFSEGEMIREHTLYLPILLLILAGAFTKSAQFPFHFWLPGAMEAPTPVSAYLHSATMVKAGVYLLARLNPVLGGTDEWHYIITSVGAATMLVGAILALLQTDLKRILAYSTVSALGTLMLLLGLSTKLATKAAVVFLLVHSLYKGALFLVAGIIDHETGTRNLNQLGGLRRWLPITAVTGCLAALSMAGLPPLFGFISKELLYEAKLQAPHAGLPITLAGVIANILMVAIAGRLSLKIFFGKSGDLPKAPHEAPLAMWLGPTLLAGLGLVIGVAPDLIAKSFVASAVSAARAEETTIKLALWHGLNPILALSVFTVLCGAVVYASERIWRRFGSLADFDATLGPARWYHLGLDGLNWTTRTVTQTLQSGYLRVYILVIIVTAIGLAGYTLLSRVELNGLSGWSEIQFHEWVIALLILCGTLGAVTSSSRLAAVASLGVVGYGVALIFVLYSAPDLAITQFAIETLTVILFVLVIYRLPRFDKLSSMAVRIRDLVVALSAGALITGLVLAVTSTPLQSRLTPYFAENSVPLAKGRNIVNVILVDFRALDTLGEITVLAVAAIGVFGLLKLRPKSTDEQINS